MPLALASCNGTRPADRSNITAFVEIRLSVANV